MQSETLRQMVRDLLAKELQRIKIERKTPEPSIREETVSIVSDADLVDFVRRLLRMAADPETRSALETGRIRFKLGTPDQHQSPKVTPSAPPTRPHGFMSEKQIDQLPAGTTVLTVGKGVRFTPLAKDRLRAKNITIERTG